MGLMDRPKHKQRLARFGLSARNVIHSVDAVIVKYQFHSFRNKKQRQVVGCIVEICLDAQDSVLIEADLPHTFFIPLFTCGTPSQICEARQNQQRPPFGALAMKKKNVSSRLRCSEPVPFHRKAPK